MTASPYGGYAQGSANQSTTSGGTSGGTAAANYWETNNVPDHLITGTQEYNDRNYPSGGGPDPIFGDPTSPADNINPIGGPRGGGGRGGGGGGGSVDYSKVFPWLEASRPQDFTFNELEFDPYTGQPFREFNSGQFDTARAGIGTWQDNANQRSNTAFDLARDRWGQALNPYTQGPRTGNPGIDKNLQASMNAFSGAGQGAANQAQFEGVQADRAMGSVYDLLGKATDQFEQHQLAGIEGDRMQRDQQIGHQGQMMTVGVDMALARAWDQYVKDKFEYGEEIARKNYDAERANILYNNQGNNQVGQANTQAANDWRAGISQQVMEMLASGGKGIPDNPMDWFK